MNKKILAKENVLLNVTLGSKEEAIRKTGQVLVDNGYVGDDYIEKMLAREELTSTYMGNYIAIPHGTEDAKKMVEHSGLSIIQAPNGVDFGGGNIVKILIGIAGKGDEHLEILSKIALVCADEENVNKLVAAKTEEEILSLFEGVN